MQKRARHWRGACLRLSLESSRRALRIVTTCLSAPKLNGNLAQWVSIVKLLPGSAVPVLVKKPVTEGAGRDQAPRLSCSRQGRRFLCFLSFRRDKKKGRRGAGRSARGLCSYPLKVGFVQNPGVSPPDGDILFYWPKRVCRKGPATGVEHAFANLGFINNGAAVENGLLIRTGEKREPLAMGLLRQGPHL